MNPPVHHTSVTSVRHYIINHSIFICPFESGKCGKKRKKLHKITFPRAKQAF